MATITITLPQELRDKLSTQENQSGLIAGLLETYFEKEENPEILKIKREQLVSNMNSKIKEIDYEIELMERERETEISKIEKSKEKQEELINNTIKNARDVFGFEITKEQAQEYLSSKYETLEEFLDAVCR